jgi:hypothetical protein
MKSIVSFWISVCCFMMFFAPQTRAHVFDMSTAKFAPYVKGIYGSGFENTTVAKSVGSNTTMEAKFSSLLGGEFGFAWASPSLNFRFAVEMLLPTKLEDIKGYNASNQELFSADSSMNVVSPKIGFDFNFKSTKLSRWFVFVEGGSSTLTSTNNFTLTAQGNTDLAVSTDFAEELKGSSTMYQYGAGGEIHVFDTTTMYLEAGYRSMEFASMNYNKDVTNIGGVRTKGTVALNSDGSNRELTLTGYYGSLGFRIYIY